MHFLLRCLVAASLFSMPVAFAQSDAELGLQLGYEAMDFDPGSSSDHVALSGMSTGVRFRFAAFKNEGYHLGLGARALHLNIDGSSELGTGKKLSVSSKQFLLGLEASPRAELTDTLKMGMVVAYEIAVQSSFSRKGDDAPASKNKELYRFVIGPEIVYSPVPAIGLSAGLNYVNASLDSRTHDGFSGVIGIAYQFGLSQKETFDVDNPK